MGGGGENNRSEKRTDARFVTLYFVWERIEGAND